MDIVIIICGLVFSILGLWGLISLLLHLDIFIMSRRWPIIKGIIQTSQVRIEDKGIDDNGNRILLYRPEIVYRYQIEDKEYIELEPVYNSIVDQQSAEKLVAAFPTGMQTSV